MDVLLSKPFIFTIKPNFKELYDTNKLFEYFICLQRKIKESERYIRGSFSCKLSIKDAENLDSVDKLTQYKIFYEYLAELKFKEDRKEYLKILRERETELIEYLNTLDEIK